MMLPGEWIRRAGFWTLDFLGGSRVRKHFVDIKNILEHETEPAITKKQQKYLNKILRYAVENVEFYKDFKDFHSHDSFPVINKNIIRNNYEAFQSPKYRGAKVFPLHTSGSTGTPFVVRQDKNKRNRVYAEMMYLWGRAGYQIGMRYVFFRIWTSLNRRNKLTSLARNVLMFNILRLEKEDLEYIRTLLKSDRKIRMLLGYSSTLENLANYLLAQGDSPQMFSIKTIIGIGEAFPESVHNKLRKIFNCHIVTLYSNQENGMFALECVENKEFHLNSASYHFEILKFDSDEQAEIGELGRIVITDLFNYAMPIIRYDTGDMGVWKKEAECNWHSKVLSSIQGAMVDLLFDTKGNEISPHIINVNMWPYDKLLQFQFIQEDAKLYILKLNGAKGIYEDATFVHLFKGILGMDAEICIEHVNEIPVLASGKRKIVVNHYKKVQA